MKVLFDQNAPRPLARYLTKHVVTRSAELGWEMLKNGKLINLAEATGFEAMVTADRNLSHQQNLAGRSLAIVVLPSGQWPKVKLHIAEIVKAVDEATPGSFQDLSPKKRPNPGGFAI